MPATVGNTEMSIRGRQGFLESHMAVKVTHTGKSVRVDQGRAITEGWKETSRGGQGGGSQEEKLELVPEGSATTRDDPKC